MTTTHDPHALTESDQPSRTHPPFRIVTASSLFDGHDASINLFRRLLQRSGAEVIHIGHNRSAKEVAMTALQEDADAVCVSSYQGGHMEYYRYLHRLLQEEHAQDIAIFGGGGGTMLHEEINILQKEGVSTLYHADDGRRLGLDGIIRDMLQKTHKTKRDSAYYNAIATKLAHHSILSETELAKAITLVEEPDLDPASRNKLLDALAHSTPPHAPPILGITGSGGAGKSSLVDEIVTRFLYSCPEGRIGILAFDPTKRKTGGALLGDRIRMNAIYHPRAYMRSMATRGSPSEMSLAVRSAIALMKASGFDLIILETSGIGQGDTAVVAVSDLSVYVMTSEYGASTQLEKIDMIDYADCVVINKFDKMGAEDAFEDVLHAYARTHDIPLTAESRKEMPVFGTIASNFNNPGVTRLFVHLANQLKEMGHAIPGFESKELEHLDQESAFEIVPPDRSHYLGEIAKNVHDYRLKAAKESTLAAELFHFTSVLQHTPAERKEVRSYLQDQIHKKESELGPAPRRLIEEYHTLKERYLQKEFTYRVRDQEIHQELTTKSLSDTVIPKIAVPHFTDWGEIVRFMRLENFPGYFPFTAGVFPLKSTQEEPKRQFAGEGGPSRTNKRFHYLCEGEPAKRLSTAFDSVTLYGEDPGEEPDIYGKVGNSGVSIATLDHMKQLYAGFDLTDPLTSVSLTINGPAPAILAMLFNTAIDFEVEKQTGQKSTDTSTYQSIKKEVLEKIRGTVQADILKEEQGQNTCIFSSKFALKMMGDIQEYFIRENVRNFYSVSISGYHIAEAGANPISQLAFTLANGFTYVEYYLSRGMQIDDFARNLSFFFSAGLDPEYSVLGRVARRIWSVTLRDKYGANERSCKLKYHIQTSGRSLHAQEIAFNDIRTTLQALISIYDHCNSLHTNAYDEAITTPTEESVRRAMAIQQIILKEFGLTKCQNPMQGSFIYDQLTDLVEEAVLQEFESLSRRGGVLGAMEKQYQRHRIQTESMKYERQKASGELPIIGVNTFLGPEEENRKDAFPVIRATEQEKKEQIASTRAFIERAGTKNREALHNLKKIALSGENIFEELMETVKYASLGQITHMLYTCGGKYRRSM